MEDLPSNYGLEVRVPSDKMVEQDELLNFWEQVSKLSEEDKKLAVKKFLSFFEGGEMHIHWWDLPVTKARYTLGTINTQGMYYQFNETNGNQPITLSVLHDFKSHAHMWMIRP